MGCSTFTTTSILWGGGRCAAVSSESEPSVGRAPRACGAESPLPWLLGVLACCCAAPGPATQSDWLQLLELFLSMGAVQLDRAAAAVQPRPKHAPKVQFVLSIPTPDPRAARWGTSAAGRPLNMSVEADRVAAAAWYVTLRKGQRKYPH